MSKRHKKQIAYIRRGEGFTRDHVGIHKNNINRLKLNNIEIYNNNLEKGIISKSPYDLIFIDNPLIQLFFHTGCFDKLQTYC